MTRRPVTVALTTALLALTGCSSASGSGAADDPEAANVALAAKLENSFRDIPGVVYAGTTYQDNITAPATMATRLTVASPADFTPVLDEVTRQIWLSDLDPLRFITISAGDGGQHNDKRDYFINQDADRTALEQLYGPRPD